MDKGNFFNEDFSLNDKLEIFACRTSLSCAFEVVESYCTSWYETDGLRFTRPLDNVRKSLDQD